MTITTDLIGANSWSSGPIRSGPLLGEVGAHDAFVWAQSRDTAPLTLRLYAGQAQVAVFSKTPLASEGLCVVFHVTGIDPGADYEYELVSTHGIAPPSSPRYRLRAAPPQNARHARIALGSCFKHWASKDLTVFDAIVADSPDIFVMTGDTSYLPQTPQDDDEDMRIHLRHRNNASLRKLLANVSTVAVWDDHDFGPNDADVTYAGKQDSLANFARMWAQRAYGLPEVGVRGIFSSVRCGPVEIFLLDVRLHRIQRLRILGDEQLAWLKRSLAQSDAAVKLVVSGSVVLPEFVTAIEGGTWEGWRRDAAGELEALLSHIEAHDIRGVVLASGDLHLGYIMHRSARRLWDGSRGPEYWELVSSPLANSPWPTQVKVGSTNPIYDPGLLEEIVSVNYGLVDIDLDRDGSELSLSLRDEHGNAIAERPVALHSLRVRPRKRRLVSIMWPNGDAYFFDGGAYLRYDADPADEGVLPGYPRPIAGNWPGLAETLGSDLDAAIVWPGGMKAYFFKGNGYVRYSIGPNEGVDSSYPRYISAHWPGLWSDGIDAAVLWPNGKAYFFRGNEYVRYNPDPAQEGAEGTPRPINGNWPGLAEAFPSGVDSAVVWPNGKAYFFRGEQYVRYTIDPANEGVDKGYPKPITSYWRGLDLGLAVSTAPRRGRGAETSA